MRRIAWLPLVALLVVQLAEAARAAGDTRGELEPMAIRTWQTESGLPQNTVTAVVQTRDGYLWVGTQRGLARFDGVRFRVFDEQNTPALRSSRIVQLHEDADGALWIGTENCGLARLSGGEFTAFRPPRKGTPHDYARVLCDDSSGALWMVSCEWQLIRLGGTQFTVPSSGWALSGNRALSVARDDAGEVWVGTDRELAMRAGDGWRVEWDQSQEVNFRVDALAPARGGGCWVSAGGRVRKYRDRSWAVDFGANPWTERPIYQLKEDQHGRVWVATLGSGLFCLQTNFPARRWTTKEGLPSDLVRCVTEDREGNIWIGTEGGGLCQLKRAVFQAMGRSEGLSSDQVLSVSEAEDGELFVGTNGDGLNRLKEGAIESHGAAQGLGNGHVWSVLRDRSGRTWAGTWGGLFRADRDGPFQVLSDGARIGWVALGLYEDVRGAIWVGHQGLGTVVRIDGDGVTAVRIPGAASDLDARVFAEDQEGGFWIGTSGDGLYHRRSDGGFTRFGRTNGLQSEVIWSLRADRDGALWIGTYGGGLSRWRAGKLATVTTREGLAHDVICQILEDDAGHLWMGSHGGVFRVSKAELNRCLNGEQRRVTNTSYTQADGLPSLECSGGFQPSGCRTRDGRLWFPTVKGLAVVRPAEVPRNPLPPPVVVERVILEDSLVGGRDAASARTGAAGSPLKVAHGPRRFEFHYTALSLTAPEKVRFRYRLDGLERDWVDAGSRRVAYYSYIPPGHYRFEVIACNNDGVWSDTEGGVFAFIVPPRVWETWWFAGMVVLALAGAAGGMARALEKRRAQRRFERLEQQRALERERSRIAQDIHDDLGASLTQIALLSHSARGDLTEPQKARASLDQVCAASRELTRAMDEIVWAVNPRHDTLDSLATYLGRFAHDFLAAAGIRCRLDLPIELPRVDVTSQTRHHVFLAFKEALNNVVKHAGATEVHVRLQVEEGGFAVLIEDNGRGLVPCRDAVEAPGGNGRMVTGHGLENLRRRLAGIGGRCEWAEHPQGGTVVRLVVLNGVPTTRTLD